jgi:Porin subfamily
MIRKNGRRFSDKIMFQRRPQTMIRFDLVGLWSRMRAMHHASSSRGAARFLRLFGIAAAALLLIAASGASVVAQALTGPGQRTPSPQPGAAKSAPAAKLKSCGAFGAGFVNIPGTDACVKIGGSVDAAVSAGSGR